MPTLEHNKAIDGSPMIDADIFSSVKIDDEWSELQPETELNGVESWDGQVSVTLSGKRVYFASNRAGGMGGTDLYYSELSDTGTWTTPINLGPAINTINNEQWPFIAPDDSTLYFVSNGYFGMGGSDVYISRLNNNNQWQEPQNIGVPFNTEADEAGVCTDLTGNTLYFASNRVGDQGGWDIYQALLRKISA
jgi:Tol biopolymer transport system component